MDNENVTVVTLIQNSQEYQDLLKDFVKNVGQLFRVVKVYFVLFMIFSFVIFLRLNFKKSLVFQAYLSGIRIPVIFC